MGDLFTQDNHPVSYEYLSTKGIDFSTYITWRGIIRAVIKLKLDVKLEQLNTFLCLCLLLHLQPFFKDNKTLISDGIWLETSI